MDNKKLKLYATAFLVSIAISLFIIGSAAAYGGIGAQEVNGDITTSLFYSIGSGLIKEIKSFIESASSGADALGIAAGDYLSSIFSPKGNTSVATDNAESFTVVQQGYGTSAALNDQESATTYQAQYLSSGSASSWNSDFVEQLKPQPIASTPSNQDNFSFDFNRLIIDPSTLISYTSEAISYTSTSYDIPVISPPQESDYWDFSFNYEYNNDYIWIPPVVTPGVTPLTVTPDPFSVFLQDQCNAPTP